MKKFEAKDCKNLEESYGEICVKCNKCGRFDKDGTKSEVTMGMMIDVTIKNGIDLIDVIKEYWPSDKAIDTVGELVKIAKKYQKIEEIVEHWACCGNATDSMMAISEAIKDENDR